MAKSNAMKRLERLLSNEDYGPKLARLNRTDEAHILDMIDRNVHYTKVHKELDRLDAARRQRNRTRRNATKAKTTRVVKDIKTLRAEAYANMRNQLHTRAKYNERNNRKFSSYMDRKDAEYAATASADQLADSAKAMPYIDIGYDINPFWYH